MKNCGLCKMDAPNASWEISPGHINTVKVKLSQGSCDPDGGSDVQHWTLDICPECFHKKLIPWFRAQGGVETEHRTNS